VPSKAGKKPFLAVAVLAGVVVLALSTCRTTQKTVARLATPTPDHDGPARTSSATTRTMAAPLSPTPTPTVVEMPVVTTPPASVYDRQPGVLYEERAPTPEPTATMRPAVTPSVAAPATVAPRPTSTESPTASPRPTSTQRPTATPKPIPPTPTKKPGVYYEEPDYRPATTFTPTPAH